MQHSLHFSDRQTAHTCVMQHRDSNVCSATTESDSLQVHRSTNGNEQAVSAPPKRNLCTLLAPPVRSHRTGSSSRNQSTLRRSCRVVGIRIVGVSSKKGKKLSLTLCLFPAAIPLLQLQQHRHVAFVLMSLTLSVAAISPLQQCRHMRCAGLHHQQEFGARQRLWCE